MKCTSLSKFVFVALCVGIFGLLVSPATVSAMPNFARQYSVDCSMCHTVIPRLNKTGYEFRRAGFRLPAEIGETRDFEKNREDFSFIGANYFSARLQMNLSAIFRNHASDTGGYDPAGDTYSRFQVEFKEFTLYPLTGGFLGNWAAESEISGTTDEIEVENAYIRYVNGDEKFFWEVRLGIFHPFEGYGASDRPLSLSRPLIQTTKTRNALGDINGFHPWGFDQFGIEGGLTFGDTSISVALFNGLMEDADDPAQGGPLEKSAGSPTENRKDFQVFVNQFLGETGAAISLYFYDGAISLSGDEGLYENEFLRWAVYANYPIGKLNLLAGYGGGRDKDQITDQTANSSGFFAEADLIFNEHAAIGARFDTFDPSDLIDGDRITAGTFFVNLAANNGLQLIAEYRAKISEHGANPDQTDNRFNLRFIYIW